jgi:hypothetical protein
MPNNSCPIDFDDMYKAADEISSLTFSVEQLEIEIQVAESELTRIVTTNPEYYVNGKKPAQNYIATVYFGGLDGSLLNTRRDLARKKADLIKAKTRFDVMKLQLDVWRTESANERKMI